jgi:hypothetical protein
VTTEHGSGGASAVQTATLDGIFRLNARRAPDADALIDPPNRSAFTDGAPRRLSYAQVDRAVSALCAQLRELGLAQGSVVGLQAPNTVESVIGILGIMRAGLVAAPLPLLWRKPEVAKALTATGARALIVCGRVGGVDHADIALHAAAEAFSIRFVCGFGENLPDGIVPLNGIWTETLFADDPGLTEPGADDIAAVTFDFGPEGPVPIHRTHTELLVGGLAVVLECGLPKQAAIVGTMLLSSFPVLASTLVPWLLTGGTLALHQPFEASVLSQQLAAGTCDALVVPGPVLPELMDAGAIPEGAGLGQVLAVWRAPDRQAAAPALAGAASVIDILAFGEFAVLPLRRRADGTPGRFSAGVIATPSGSAGGTAVLTLSATANGALALGGPMIPAALRVAAKAFPAGEVDSGYSCRIDGITGALMLSAIPAGIGSVGDAFGDRRREGPPSAA